jgi:hypothetical protein
VQGLATSNQHAVRVIRGSTGRMHEAGVMFSPCPCPCTLTCFMNICMRHFLKLRSSLHTWQKEQVER